MTAAIVTTIARVRTNRKGYAHGDFMTYYAWGAEYQHGEELWVATTKRGEILPGLRRARFCNYTPAFIELFAPLTRLTQKAAFWIWIALQLLSLAAAMILLARNCDPPLKLATTAVVVALSYLFRPVAALLDYAQWAPLLLFLITISWVCARRDKPWLAGLSLAAAALLKAFPGALVGYFVFRRRWRETGWFAAFLILGIIVTDPRNWIEYMLHGTPAYLPVLANLNISVLAYSAVTISRWLSTGSPSEVLAMTAALTAAGDVAIVAVAAFVTAHAGERAESQGLAFALWAMAALLLSPLTGSYDLVLVLPAYLFAYVNAAWIVQNTEQAASPALLVGVILIVAAGLHNFTGMPGIHPPVVALVLQYLGAALILKARTNAQGGESAPPLTAPRPLSDAPGSPAR